MLCSVILPSFEVPVRTDRGNNERLCSEQVQKVFWGKKNRKEIDKKFLAGLEKLSKTLPALRASGAK